MKLTARNNRTFSSIFDELLLDNKLDVPSYENFSIPKVNISEKDSNFVLEFLSPGLHKENFKIEVEENLLTVSYKNDNNSEENTHKEEEVRTFVRKEFDLSNFSRSFKLSKNINTKSVKATYVNGILKVVLAKKEEKDMKRMVEIS